MSQIKLKRLLVSLRALRMELFGHPVLQILGHKVLLIDLNKKEFGYDLLLKENRTNDFSFTSKIVINSIIENIELD